MYRELCIEGLGGGRRRRLHSADGEPIAFPSLDVLNSIFQTFVDSEQKLVRIPRGDLTIVEDETTPDGITFVAPGGYQPWVFTHFKDDVQRWMDRHTEP